MISRKNAGQRTRTIDSRLMWCAAGWRRSSKARRRRTSWIISLSGSKCTRPTWRGR
ncbi:unnamed protein product [Heligmosomoides polygyrus]|uniref:Uncharacterized protein n=1 Tax=Heligmosomoides polygyrus TaxID=6339 RepID=A0A3P7XVQ8_HELPZ|nr:unnamed protein product [Heligmosomoides polygyrus]